MSVDVQTYASKRIPDQELGLHLIMFDPDLDL